MYVAENKANQNWVDFYKDSEILITGGTGFIGKGIIECLLRVTKVKRIHILIRTKKTQSPAERLEQLKKDVIFDVLLKEQPTALNDRLAAVPGDISELELGLISESKNQLLNVSIVLHAAATIRFDEPMKKALLLNVRGTRELLNLALESLPKLQMFLHVSTMYCNPYVKDMDEKIYPPQMNWKSLVKLAGEESEEVINCLTPKLIKNFPNTYTFTKHLSEQVVNEYRNKLPVTIVRPSVVSCTVEKPFAGYLDNIVALNGIAAGVSTGAFRVLPGDPRTKVDVVPLDFVVETIIISTWYSIKRLTTDSLFIVNCCLPHRSLPLLKSMRSLAEHCYDIPLEFMLWKPSMDVINLKLYFMFLVLTLHLLPAFLIDTVLILTGRKPVVMKGQRMIFATSMVLKFFTTETYQFQHRNLTHIVNISKEIESGLDLFTKADIPYKEFFQANLIGVRRHIFKMSDETIPRSKKLIKFLYFIDYSIKVIAVYLVGKFVFKFLTRML